MLVYSTNSSEETLHLGEKIGEVLQPGMVILLYGQLGAGKTCLAGGILRGLGITDHVTSPTFTLINEYDGSLGVAHFDLYRLNHPDELYDIGFEEYLDGERVILMEWPERAGGYLPDNHLTIKLQGKNNHRTINIDYNGEEYEPLYEELRNIVNTGD